MKAEFAGRRVLVKEGGEWVAVGAAFRQPRGGGWNVEFPDGVPECGMVLADNRGFAPGEVLRLMLTRPGLRGGTDWFEVGEARVTRQGRGVLLSVDTVLPAGVSRLVVLPGRRR